MTSSIGKREVGAETSKWSWQAGLLWALRGVLILTIIAETISGDYLWAADALLALGLCALPGAVFRAHKGPASLDIEIVLLAMAIGNCTLGVACNLYRSWPYYDKVLHIVNPMALAYCFLLFVWAVVDAPRADLPVAAVVVFVALAVLGASTVWEIVEFVSDQLARTSTQGSPVMGPLLDTMWDLILSAVGALLGATGGVMAALRFGSVGERQQKGWYS